MTDNPVFILEDAILDHLATPEGAMAIYKERLDPKLLSPNEDKAYDVLTFVLAYIDEGIVSRRPLRSSATRRASMSSKSPKCLSRMSLTGSERDTAAGWSRSISARRLIW